MIENGQMDGEPFKHIIRNVSGMKIAKNEYNINKNGLTTEALIGYEALIEYESLSTDKTYNILRELQRKYNMHHESVTEAIPVSKVEGSKKKEITWEISDDPMINAISNLKNSMLNVGSNFESHEQDNLNEKLNEMKNLQKEKTRKFVEGLHKYNRRK
jgi:hypothetical protein